MRRLARIAARLAWPLTVLAVAAIAATAANPAWRAGVLSRVGWASPISTAEAAPLPAVSHQPAKTEAILLSEQGLWSAGIELGTAEHRTYERSVVYPGIVRTCPGRSVIKIPAPLTGIVTHIYRERGEAVTPGQPLFKLALTHEELIRDQADYLAAMQKAKILAEEVQRLNQAADVIPRKDIVQREYELRQVRAELDTLRQVLQLHRLPEAEIALIEGDKPKLVDSLDVVVPQDIAQAGSGSSTGAAPPVLQIQDLNVERGQHVVVGETMCTIADHSELQIEGSAFEAETRVLHEAIRLNRPVAAVFESEDGSRKQVKALGGLRLQSIDDRVDSESRTARFVVRLPNDELVYDRQEGQRRFIGRQYKPGQRCKLQVSVESLPNSLVLPTSAVAEDRGQACVFLRDGDRFVLRLVKVLHRDQVEVVVDDQYGEERITRHDVLALTGAGQLLAAIRSGGALQPTCDCGQQH